MPSSNDVPNRALRDPNGCRAVRGVVRAARRGGRGRVGASGQVRVRRAAQHLGERLSRQGVRHQSAGRDRARGRCVAQHRRNPGRRGRPRVGVYTCRRERGAARVVRGQGNRVPRSWCRADTAKRAPKAPPRNVPSSRTCERLGIVLAGPNGQGVVSTPANLCAQIVAPYPPRGAHQHREPVGQLRVELPQLGVGHGGRRRPRCPPGTRPRSGLPTTSTAYSRRRRDRVGLAYVEGIIDGRAFADRVRAVTPSMPRGAGEGRRRPTVAHTRRPVTRARWRRTTRCSMDVSPSRRNARGNRRGSVRGRGHVRHAAVAGGSQRGGAHDGGRMGRGGRRRDHRDRDLALVELPADLHAEIDALLPPRWSHANPVDLAGGETRDTIPEIFGAHRRASRRARHRVSRARHPIEPGAADARTVRSTPPTASTASWPITSGKTPASQSRHMTCRSRPASRFSPRPSSPWPIRPMRGRWPCGRRVGSATRSANRAVTALGHSYRYGEWLRRRDLA